MALEVLRRISEVDRQFRRLSEKEHFAVVGGSPLPEDYAQFSTMCLWVIDYACTMYDKYYQWALQAVRRIDDLTSAALAMVLVGLVHALRHDVRSKGLPPVQTPVQRLVPRRDLVQHAR
jgi:hypothetical protein